MSALASLRQTSGPNVAVELASRRVSAATLEVRGGHAVVAAHASEPLPDGVLVPSLTTENAHDRGAIVGALERVFDRIGGRPRHVGLVVPDLIAKVSLVRFEQVPARTQDLDQLVRWQVKKTAPFAIEEAQVSYVPGIRAPDGQEFIVSLARRSVVEEYEQLCAEAGAHAGPSPEELHTFVVAPPSVQLPEPLNHPIQLYSHFVRYLEVSERGSAA